jgi:hypothetical protein
VVVLLAIASPARAQTFTVTGTANSGTGSLRAAVEAANAAPGADTIAFASGVTGTISLSGSGLTIRDSVEIDGPGAGQLTVEQTSEEHRVFKIAEFATPGAVTLSGLHIANGWIEDNGADVYNENSNASLTISGCIVSGARTEKAGYGGAVDGFGAPLTVRDSTFSGNEGSNGGAIWAGGDETQLIIEDSTFADNKAEGGGGAVLVEVEHVGEHRISGSTFVGNYARDAGGAVDVSSGNGAPVLIANSTFTGNQTPGAGGAIATGGESLTVTIEDSTIAGNHATGATHDGGGVSFFNVENLVDTIVAGNTSAGAGPDLSGKALASFDLIDNPADAELTELVPGSDLLGVDPQLGPLAENGGPTETMALPPSSPAVNKGGGSLGLDQRGDVRPSLYPGVPLSSAPGANGADIGAYELQAPRVAARRLRVRVSCPKGAKPGGCKFALQAVSGKPKRVKGHLRKPMPESAVARTKLAPGRHAILTLKPKPKFAAKLEAAKKILVREVETAKGRTHTGYRRLRLLG